MKSGEFNVYYPSCLLQNTLFVLGGSHALTKTLNIASTKAKTVIVQIL